MLVLLSPAKTLDMSSPIPDLSVTQPRMLKSTNELVDILKNYDVAGLKKLMGVSDKIATLNVERFRGFAEKATASNAHPALAAFKGDVYAGMDADSFSEADYEFAQTALRMLSGLYGVLRPLDLMQAYRLEMGTQLATNQGKNLYEFWDSRITDILNNDLAEYAHKTIINLASKEYYSSVKPKALASPVLTLSFKEKKNGAYKVIGLLAKRARGMMARYIVKERLSSETEALKDFNDAGYRFMPSLSYDSEWVFAREGK